MAKKKRLRDKYIQAWVTDDEKEKIADKAKYCKISKSEYLRRMALDGYIIHKELKGIFEINSIGNNLNQIAKKVNSTNNVMEKDIDELKVLFKQLSEIVYEQILCD